MSFESGAESREVSEGSSRVTFSGKRRSREVSADLDEVVMTEGTVEEELGSDVVDTTVIWADISAEVDGPPLAASRSTLDSPAASTAGDSATKTSTSPEKLALGCPPCSRSGLGRLTPTKIDLGIRSKASTPTLLSSATEGPASSGSRLIAFRELGLVLELRRVSSNVKSMISIDPFED